MTDKQAAVKQKLLSKIDETKKRLAAMQAYADGKRVWWRNDASERWQVSTIEAGGLGFFEFCEYSLECPVHNLRLELELTPEAALALLVCINASEDNFSEQLPSVHHYAPSVVLGVNASHGLLWEPLSGQLKAYLQSVPR